MFISLSGPLVPHLAVNSWRARPWVSFIAVFRSNGWAVHRALLTTKILTYFLYCLAIAVLAFSPSPSYSLASKELILGLPWGS